MSEQQFTAECPIDCPWLRWVFRLLVFAQFLIAATLVIAMRSPWVYWETTIIACAGIVVAVWAVSVMGRSLAVSPRPKENAELQTTGPYRIVRHPMYFGLLLFCAGFAIADRTWLGGLLWLALLFVLSIKIYYEERELRRRFPGYDDYRKNTKRIIPFVF